MSPNARRCGDLRLARQTQTDSARGAGSVLEAVVGTNDAGAALRTRSRAWLCPRPVALRDRSRGDGIQRTLKTEPAIPLKLGDHPPSIGDGPEGLRQIGGRPAAGAVGSPHAPASTCSLRRACQPDEAVASKPRTRSDASDETSGVACARDSLTRTIGKSPWQIAVLRKDEGQKQS